MNIALLCAVFQLHFCHIAARSVLISRMECQAPLTIPNWLYYYSTIKKIVPVSLEFFSIFFLQTNWTELNWTISCLSIQIFRSSFQSRTRYSQKVLAHDKILKCTKSSFWFRFRFQFQFQIQFKIMLSYKLLENNRKLWNLTEDPYALFFFTKVTSLRKSHLRC